MANESFLAGLAGAVTGISEGLRDVEETRRYEKEREFRLRQYEAEQRRNAMLDALNQEVSRGRMELMRRAQENEDARLRREQEQMELLPYETPTGETKMLPRGEITNLESLEAQALMQRELSTYPWEVDGRTVRVTGEGLLEQRARDAERDARRRETMERQIGNFTQSYMTAHPLATFDEIEDVTIRYAKLRFPEEFEGVEIPEKKPEAEIAETEGEEGEGGLFARLKTAGLAVREKLPAIVQGAWQRPDVMTNLVKRAYTPQMQQLFGPEMTELQGYGGELGDLAVEPLRRAMYGPKPPQTLEELRAAQVAALQRGGQ